MLKILFVTQDDPFYIPKFFKEFDRIFHDPEVHIEGVVIQAPLGKKSLKSLVNQMLDFYGFTNFIRYGFRFAVSKVLNSIAIKGFKGKFPGSFSVEHYFLKHKWNIIKANNVNSPSFVKMVQDLGIELIISVSASQKFKPAILTATKYGCINIHNARLPKNRGMLPSFWCLLDYENEPVSAMTVFKMNEDLDSGDIILQRDIKLDPKESLENLIVRTKIENAHAIKDTIELYKKGEPKLLPNDDSQATYFTFPTKADVKKFKAKGLTDMKALMTVDVEDWFQTENFKERIPPKEWDNQALRVKDNVSLMLDIMAKKNHHGTFFILGWIAERAPEVVKAIQAGGHEIASHGYGHECIYNLTPEQFRADLQKSRDIIENISGTKLKGYRAPNFSITDWAIDILKEEGFEYDSSYFPVMHDRYGKLTKFKTPPDTIFELRDNFYEIPLSCVHLFGKNIPWSGGGYFRLLPYFIFKRGIQSILNREHTFNFYIHPWEVDPGQPRIRDMHKVNRFRHYNNIEKTESRFTSMLNDFQFQSIAEFIESKQKLN